VAPNAVMRRHANLPRSAGILLHPTSLPAPHGIGAFGDDAHRFLDCLEQCGVTLWQMLPLGPTGFGDSPYQCFSAFAGNPLLIAVVGDGTAFPAHEVDYGRVIPHKLALLADMVRNEPRDERYATFVVEESEWLLDYALFRALKDAHHGAVWTEWERGAAMREPEALERWQHQLAARIEYYQVEQFLFFSQFRALRQACVDRGIRLMGDLPIYVAHDSADVWANRSLFKLDANGRPRAQAGVPPDYFSATGQLWGNPIYDWDALARTGYEWWIRRVRAMFSWFDLVRIDHFRGFEAYWEVPAGESTAINGRWVPAPGDALFEAIDRALGPVPIIAENLGLITPEVEALRERWGFPGMGVLQFAFGGDPMGPSFRPHNLPHHSVLYTGTHDNDTTVGWWNSSGGHDSTRQSHEVHSEKEFARRYLNTDGREIHWYMIRAALASVSDTVIIPLQDVLGLGSEARMNFPGRPDGNWRFRFSWDQIAPETTRRLRDLVEIYDR
jgi:4-alpha-glucanotransferase